MSGVELDDILQQAERLTADLDGGNELPRVQRNLQQILDAGQRLCSGTPATHDNAEVRASLLLSRRGHEIPQISDRLRTLTSAAQTLEPLEPVCDTDIEGFLRNERENAILAVLEEQKSKAFQAVEKYYWQSRMSEWEKQKQSILGKLIGSDGTLNFTQEFSEAGRVVDDYNTSRSVSRSAMDTWEVGYAQQVYIYNEKVLSGSIRPNFVDLCQITAEKIRDENIISLWNMVKYVLNAEISVADKSVLARRLSKNVISSVVGQARSYLEDMYRDYMMKCVHQRPHVAQLGGRPGTINLVKSFLKVKPPHQVHEYRNIDWAILYFCLRCGDLEAACEVAQSLDGTFPELSGWINEYAKDRTLSPTSENKLLLQYKRSIRNAGNPYAIAIFCILGHCDFMESHTEIAGTTDDYLWVKLCQVVVEKSSSTQSEVLTLLTLQKLLSDYGESHFNATSNPLLYFQVLFLTYQFEAAIEFLSRFPSLRCHALHVALALHEANLLVKATNLHDGLISSKPSDQSQFTNVQRLNLPRLLMMYTRKFELTDPREALNYLYFLRDERHENESLFLQCTSELIRETGEFSMLLGGLNPDGSRRPGLVDRYCAGDTKELIAKVAADTEAKGLFEDAIRLYDLCGNYDNVITLLNRLMCPLLPSADRAHSDRVRIKDLAVSIAQRYRSLAVELSQDLSSTFYVLLDLLTFFDQYHLRRYDTAMDIINQLHILPTKPEQVQDRVRNFSAFSEEVRQNIGEILLATMNMLASQKKALQSNKILEVGATRSYASALLTFAGMLPYQLPGDITSKLVQIEVDMM
ncbi:nuclear pore complex protein Nup93-like [Styela clava]